ncbi:hypothetical protein PanWU01x14_180800 [Parasponia andersonii]|uniref:Uncharacterized protein n=1 Tax=Parasponia andersonii TaxID=3476 RepID=A0A2P5C614_PARAD|nr:hypothetical protein PanWU01x14_180800 [Parasponia andersonii]
MRIEVNSSRDLRGNLPSTSQGAVDENLGLSHSLEKHSTIAADLDSNTTVSQLYCRLSSYRNCREGSSSSLTCIQIKKAELIHSCFNNYAITIVANCRSHRKGVPSSILKTETYPSKQLIRTFPTIRSVT